MHKIITQSFGTWSLQFVQRNVPHWVVQVTRGGKEVTPARSQRIWFSVCDHKASTLPTLVIRSQQPELLPLAVLYYVRCDQLGLM